MTTFEWSKGTVSGQVDRPRDPVATLVLGHGAGAGYDSPFMSRVAAALTARSMEVVRFNFPYMEAGRKAPGSQSDAESCFRAVLAAVRPHGMPLVAGGKSYGGRIASHVVSEGEEVDGLVFLGYPLHPPGKPEALRDEHLYRIEAPMLFVQGTRDPFARPDLVRDTVRRLAAARLFEVPGGNHSLAVRGRAFDEVADEVGAEVESFIARRR